MIKMVILGAGNVAFHLFKALNTSSKIEILQVYNRSKANLNDFESTVSTTTNIEDIVEADVYLIALKDDVIEEIANKIKLKDALFIHTSGAISLEVFKDKKRAGVFYPLQTFSKQKAVSFTQIPICIEANSKTDLDLLKIIASQISSNIHEIDSQQRKSLHVAAVFVSNFVNHLYYIGEEICANNDIPFSILQPLIEETSAKIKTLKPELAQTGPAKRNDEKTISSHLSLLSTQQQEIYKTLTQSIQKVYGKEL